MNTGERVTEKGEPFDFFLFHGLQDLDNTSFARNDVDAVEHLTVLAATNLPNDFIILLVAGRGSGVLHGGTNET